MDLSTCTALPTSLAWVYWDSICKFRTPLVHPLNKHTNAKRTQHLRAWPNKSEDVISNGWMDTKSLFPLHSATNVKSQKRAFVLVTVSGNLGLPEVLHLPEMKIDKHSIAVM